MRLHFHGNRQFSCAIIFHHLVFANFAKHLPPHSIIPLSAIW